MKLIREIKEEYKITDKNSCSKYLNEFKNEDREYFIVLGLDTENKVLYREVVTIGTLNSTIIHPRETFKRAILSSCNSIILAHNHPSNNISPSPEDIETHKKLKQCGEILDIKVLDCLIITNKEIVSFNEAV